MVTTIRGRVRDTSQGIGGGSDEGAPVQHPLSSGSRPAVIKQILRDIRKNHMPGSANPVHGTEPDQPVPGPHVQQRLATLDLGTVQDLIAPRAGAPAERAAHARAAAGGPPWGCQRQDLRELVRCRAKLVALSAG